MPGELWSEVFPGIFVAASRVPKSEEQVRIYEKELVHARIIVAEGYTVYFLPERGPWKVKHPDAIVDGLIWSLRPSLETEDRCSLDPSCRNSTAVGVIRIKGYTPALSEFTSQTLVR